MSSRISGTLIPRVVDSERKLVEVDRVAFQNLAQGDVEEINLADNKLRSISDKTFLALDSLKHLHLGGNPWFCDCQLKSFRDLVVHRYGKFKSSCNKSLSKLGFWS